jgi:hypothetical protein
MTKSIVAVIVGYLIFGVSSAFLFAASGHDPRLFPTLTFLLCAVVYGTLVAAVSGYVTARLAPARPLCHARIVAVMIGAIAILSMIVEGHAGSLWSEVAVLALMAPAAAFGGQVATKP